MKLNIDKHKAMRFPDLICKINKKLFEKFNPKGAHKLESADHLCLPFIDQSQ